MVADDTAYEPPAFHSLDRRGNTARLLPTLPQHPCTRERTHALVQRIVRAYESAKPQQQELPLAMGEGIQVGSQSGENQAQAQVVHPAKPQ